MSSSILLKRPGAEIGERRDLEAGFDVEPFDLYGRHHEVKDGRARCSVTRLSEGLYLDLEVRLTVVTTCDRTLEPVELSLCFGESELISGPNVRELSIEDWEIDVVRYAQQALPNELPMQVFSPGSEPVLGGSPEGEIDPRWRGLDDLFASGF